MLLIYKSETVKTCKSFLGFFSEAHPQRQKVQINIFLKSVNGKQFSCDLFIFFTVNIDICLNVEIKFLFLGFMLLHHLERYFAYTTTTV